MTNWERFGIIVMIGVLEVFGIIVIILVLEVFGRLSGAVIVLVWPRNVVSLILERGLSNLERL